MSYALVDELTRNLTKAVLPVTVFIGIEAFVGFCGNSLILLIYSKHYERSNFRYFVLSMAIIDITSCLTTLPGEIFSQMNWYTYEFGWICKVKSYFNVLTAWGSASILLLLAFDRHRKICRPLAWQIQHSLAIKLCGCSIAIAAFVSIPITILWGKQTYIYDYQGFNLTVSICEKSGQYADDIYPLVYITCVYILPVSLIMIVVVTLNIITARKLFGHESMKVQGRKKYPYVPSSTTTLTDLGETDVNSSIVVATTTSTHRSIEEFVHNLCDDSKCKDCSKPSLKCEHNNTTDSEIKTECIDCHFTPLADARTHVSFITRRRSSDSSGITRASFDSELCLNINITSRVGNSDVKRGIVRTNSECSSISTNSRGNASFNSPGSISSAAVYRRRSTSDFRRKQKTVIMLVLTSVFVVTMLLYVILISLVAATEGILKILPNSQKVLFFFFWRLYFINTVVNPILYGFLDPRFRSGLLRMAKFLTGRRVSRKKISTNSQLQNARIR